METPVQIDFRNSDNVEAFRVRIEEQIARLEERYDRIRACRIFMRGPGGHHRTGGAFEVTTHLELPNGRQVDIGRTPDVDERYGDPHFAINNAFKRARRILQNNVGRMQGQKKLHETTPTATVQMLRPEEGFGFLETSDGREIYFHRNCILSGGFDRLTAGASVVFAEEPANEGPQASTVKLAGKHLLR